MDHLATPYLWHPGANSRHYLASGSRTSFSDKWHDTAMHQTETPVKSPPWLELTMPALADDERRRWLGASSI